MSGKAPYTSSNELVGSRDTYVHFVQEPIDQGALVRPYMKWEWTLPSGVVVKEALRRAHTIMETKPAGPVYFMAQRETLTQKWAERPDPQLSGRAVLAAAVRRRRSGDDRAARRQAHRRRASDPDLRLRRRNRQERAEADRGAGDVRRHRGVRRQPDLQHLARVPLLPRLFAEQASAARPTSASWSTSTCRGSRPTCRTRTSRSGRTSTSTRSSPRRRCGPSRATCACRATPASSSGSCWKS